MIDHIQPSLESEGGALAYERGTPVARPRKVVALPEGPILETKPSQRAERVGVFLSWELSKPHGFEISAQVHVDKRSSEMMARDLNWYQHDRDVFPRKDSGN